MVEASTFKKRLNSALSKYLDPEGKVEYSALEADKTVEEFANWLKTFDNTSLSSLNEELAFWINTYNMLVVYNVIKELRKNPKFGETGNRGRYQRLVFFYKTKNLIGRIRYNFAQIEKILRSVSDPRIYFAICCASESSPPLKNSLYTAENLDRELDNAAEMFIRSPQGSRLDKKSMTLYLSAIFDWYKGDFKKAFGSVLSFVKKYLEEENRKFLEANLSKIKVDFLPYDWRLNIKKAE